MSFELRGIKKSLKPLKHLGLSLGAKLGQSSEPEEPPLRDELYSVEQLSSLAKSLAARHQVTTGNRRGSDYLLPRLADNEELLLEAHELVTDAVKRGRRLTPAAEWFLDNFHLIQEQIHTARRHLPKGYSRELPELSDGPTTGHPRVYAIVIELISHVDGRVDAETLRAFIASYQSVTHLQLGELWAIPIMLRLALLENLRRIAVRIAAGRLDRESAAHWIDRMLEVATKAPAQVVVVLAEMVKENPPLSTAFISEFTGRMQGRGEAMALPIAWLEHRVAERGQTIETVLQQTSQVQASDQVSVGNSIGSLRFLSATDWRDFVESMSSVEHILRTDPAGIYPSMDFATRDQYRHAVEHIAKRTGYSEDHVALQSVQLAGRQVAINEGKAIEPVKSDEVRKTHVGHFLVGRGRKELGRPAPTRFSPMPWLAQIGIAFPLSIYLGATFLVTTAMTGALVWQAATLGIDAWGLVTWGMLLFLCISQLASALVHCAAMLLVAPRILPRMDFSKGIPSAHRAIVAVPTMITDLQEIDDLVEALEVRFLANRDENLCFALLTDFRDAPTEKTPQDAALLQHATEGIAALNAKYVAGRFFLFHRNRRWNPKENAWMGWERKRGKLEDLNGALRGETGRFESIVGPMEALRDIRYVIALDSDTQLPRDAAHQLVGAMAHPLNRAYYDAKLGRVTEGYGILQPRIGISMPSANRSGFARVFSGDPGIDPYTNAVSDIYQDLFEEGSFIGKGIYDIDIFRQAIGGRLPENHVLSHDLLEGGYARSGLLSNVLLFEDFPSSYPADVSRCYRWIRGDWQILPWLLPRVPGANGRRSSNPLSALSRWKILDNLRRSMSACSLLVLLIIGWLLHGGAIVYTLTATAILFFPAVLNALADLIRRPTDLPMAYHLRIIGASFFRQILQQGFALACLPYTAFVSLEAIGRTTVRLLITGKRLLEWRTARDAQRTVVTTTGAFYALMWVQPATAFASILLLFLLRPEALLIAFPVISLWIAGPAIALRLSRIIKPVQAELSWENKVFLGMVARRTWRFFETFVGPADNDLPPDNYQEDPPQGIAHRTSPTNIGVSLLANLAAYDFGFIPVGEVIERTRRTLATLDKMQRHRGHFYNWYDTRTLDPLPPLYISTVDSGNLAGHLLTLAAGIDELTTQKIFRPAVVFAGLGSTLDVLFDSTGHLESKVRSDLLAPLLALRDALRPAPTTLVDSHGLLQRTASIARDLQLAIGDDADGELKWWVGALETQCGLATRDLGELAPWLSLTQLVEPTEFGHLRTALQQLNDAPAISEVARMESTLLPVIDAAIAHPETNERLITLRTAVVAAAEIAAKRVSELRALAVHCRELANIDYAFLYDENRHLLSIGYNVAERRLDGGFYDLLASEARLGSFIAIAQGKLPQEHWFSLGRSLTKADGGMALLSWSGSMFEYLMPLLVMPTYANTLLDESYHAVIHRQIEYGNQRGVPWGVSESGYTKTDAQLNYQYQAFGVPGLGLKQGLADELVVAPYASAMALMIDPIRACANLRRLAREGRLDGYGFYEAVDYSATRMPPGQSSVTVKSYMAHHQGMVFLSLAYAMLNRPMQRRFESDPAFRSADLLLQERIPKSPFILPQSAEVAEKRDQSAPTETTFRFFSSAQTPSPEVKLLSNGRYHVAVTAAGGGYSRWRNLAITRWREDATRDCWGMFCYIRDVRTGEFWSATPQPTTRPPTTFEAVYSQGRAEFRRRDGDIESHLEISVSPEDDIEMRRLSITNRGKAPRTIELTSYAEVVLAPPAADAAHPAFSNLFVQTELIRERQAILCTRRPRSASEIPPWMLHLLTVQGGGVAAPTTYETARAQFIGRGRTLADPAAMHSSRLSDSQGAVLDPIVSLRCTLTIGPDETVKVHFVTGAAETREAAMVLIEKYHDRHLADRVFELAWTHSRVVLQQLDATESDNKLFGRLAGSILYASPFLRAPGSVIARNRRGQSGLWAYGISGDLPIVLLRIGDQSKIALVRQLIQAHAYWRAYGLAVDLVVWNEDQSGYRQLLQELIMGVVASRSESSLLDKPGGIFIRRLEQISEEDKVLMLTSARVVVTDTAGTLAEQMDKPSDLKVLIPNLRPTRGRRSEPAAAEKLTATTLSKFNGIGGFTLDGREYVITTTPDSPTPAPWVNVIANPWFGTIVSESGGAYTWCENAHSYRLTPWNNDAVCDAGGELFYLRDEETGRFWSPSPLPVRGPMPYTTRHGFGYSVFEYSQDGVSAEMRVYVATDAPVKFISIKLRNTSGRPKRLSVTGFFELLLGDLRETHSPHVVTEVDPKSGALMARNSYNSEFANRVAFLDCSESIRTVTGDRTEFLGRNGSPGAPACMARARLSGRVGAGIDPCAAMQVMIELAEGQEREIAFIFGSGQDTVDARNLVTRFRGTGPAHVAMDGVNRFWNQALGAIHVETPDESINFLANGWLVYQVIASRIFGRSGFYQSGGAFGFRDQLQDTMSLVHAKPAILREQILRCASRQFREGDVQHWWHPPQGRGVRTHISDDYLWLPYATCRYVRTIGDIGVLDEKAAFLEGRILKADEDSYYDLPTRSEESTTLYDHCVRAIKHGLRFGEHGLPLMGCGDWNDGMNLVGEQGRGESVWLAFFLYDVLVQFAELASGRGDHAIVDLCTTEARKLRTNIEEHAWDGEWYRRAYFDNGEPLGSATNPECRIDSIPQSWAVLSHAADPDRARMAMDQVDRQLVKRNVGIIQLFDPPFDKSPLNPGYVKGYVPGVRENGGQYTHAAIWVVMAFAAAGDTTRAWELFQLINPLRHGESKEGIEQYKVEPYVVAADVYGNPQHAGRGGWTWYTGSAGWMYRLITESFLGLNLKVDQLHFAPCVPMDWKTFKVHYRYRETHYHITFRNPSDGKGVKSLTVDGVNQSQGFLALKDDRKNHNVEVELI